MTALTGRTTAVLLGVMTLLVAYVWLVELRPRRGSPSRRRPSLRCSPSRPTRSRASTSRRAGASSRRSGRRSLDRRDGAAMARRCGRGPRSARSPRSGPS
jgi:hypothetical protein